MSFEECCRLIKHLIDSEGYKVILRYRPNQRAFRFEKGANQYDAIDIVWMHLHHASKPKQVHEMYSKIELSIPDSLALINLASGAAKQMKGDKRYEYYQRTFESITGIIIR